MLIWVLLTGSVAMANMTATIHKINPSLPVAEVVEIKNAIYQYSNAFSLDPRLVASVIAVESRFRIGAKGKAGEIGLMQLHPKYHDAEYAVDNNIATGARYLAGLKTVYGGAYKDLRFVELYNRGPFGPKPVKFPYTKRVLKYYAMFGGNSEQLERTIKNLQSTKERRAVVRRLASETGPGKHY